MLDIFAIFINALKALISVQLWNLKDFGEKQDFWPRIEKWSIFSRTSKIGSGKNTKYFFSYWAWRTPWGHVFSLKTFRQIPVLIWAILYSVFSLSNLLVCSLQNLASKFDLNSWHLVVKFGHYKWFWAHLQIGVSCFGKRNKSLFWVLLKSIFLNFFLLVITYKKSIF